MPTTEVRPDPGSLIGTRPSMAAALRLGTAALEAAGVARARLDAEWLLAAVLGVSRTALAVQGPAVLDAPADARYAGALRRRMAREPLQHILGTQAFRNLILAVTPDVLVPRPETEVLAGWALERLPPAPGRPVVIDLGTGSGCIACAIASERPDATVIAVDVCPAAAAVARRNVAALGLGSRVPILVSDLFAGLAERGVDLVVANPPYLPSAVIGTLDPEVSRHDPRLALDGGPDGLEVIRRIVLQAPTRLAPGGVLVLETAGGDQTGAVVTLLRAGRWEAVETRADLAGVERFVAGRRA